MKIEKPTVDKSSGITTGMGVCSYFASLFEANELGNRKMTDEMIAKKVRAEFPGRKGYFFTGEGRPSSSSNSRETVNAYRQKYNAGKFTKNIPPLHFSFRYNNRGERVDARTGKYPLLPEEIDYFLSMHKSQRQHALIRKAPSPRKKR